MGIIKILPKDKKLMKDKNIKKWLRFVEKEIEKEYKKAIDNYLIYGTFYEK